MDFSNDARRFPAATNNSAPAKDIYSHPGTRLGGEDEVTRANKHDKIGLNSRNLPSEIAPPPDSLDFPVSDEHPNSMAQNAQKPTINIYISDLTTHNGRSHAHFQFEKNQAVCVSFVMEYGGILRHPLMMIN